jgi:hypothetical protein
MDSMKEIRNHCEECREQKVNGLCPTCEGLDEVDLGTANGWVATPIEYTSCRKANHPLNERKLGNCYYEYTCPICHITFRVDSSD